MVMGILALILLIKSELVVFGAFKSPHRVDEGDRLDRDGGAAAELTL